MFSPGLLEDFVREVDPAGLEVGRGHHVVIESVLMDGVSYGLAAVDECGRVQIVFRGFRRFIEMAGSLRLSSSSVLPEGNTARSVSSLMSKLRRCWISITEFCTAVSAEGRIP